MAEAYKLYNICLTCGGDGTILAPVGAGPTMTEVPCPVCLGEKIKLVGYCTFATYQIPEVPA